MEENEKVIVKEIVRIEEPQVAKAEVVGPVDVNIKEGNGWIYFILTIQTGILLYLVHMMREGIGITFF